MRVIWRNRSIAYGLVLAMATVMLTFDYAGASVRYRLGAGDEINLTAVTKTNQGAGSGLDADKLDGKESTDFISSGAGGIKDTDIDFGLSAGQVNTDDLPEGAANKYFSGKTSDNLPEGSTNLYNTADEKAALAGTSGTPSVSNKYVTNDDSRNTDSRAPSGTAGGDLAGTYPNPTIGTDKIKDTHVDWGSGANQVDTTDIPEGSNLYFTNARVDTQLDTAQTIIGDWIFDGTFIFNNAQADKDARFAGVGEANLFFVDASLNCIGVAATPIAGCRLVFPQESDAVTPTLAFGDGNTGFYEEGDDDLRISIGGTARWFLTGDDLKAISGSACAIRGVAASATVPNLIPRRTDLNTGIGSAGADQLSLITGGVERIDIDSSGNVGLSTSSFGTSFSGGLAMKLGVLNTTDVADQVHMAVVDRVAGKAGLAIRAEDGTQYIFADRAGFGTLAPSALFDIAKNENAVTTLKVRNEDAGASAASQLHLRATTEDATITVYGNSAGRKLTLNAADSTMPITFEMQGTEEMRLNSAGSLLLGTTGAGTDFAGGIAMRNGTAPTTSPTNVVQLWSGDQTAGNSCPHFRTENGSVIKLYTEAALTSGDATAIDDTYDSVEQGVLNNVRTRLDEIEDALQAQGLLG